MPTLKNVSGFFVTHSLLLLTMVAVALTISLAGCSDSGSSSDENPVNTDLVNTNQANTEQANTDQANTPVDQSDSPTHAARHSRPTNKAITTKAITI